MTVYWLSYRIADHGEAAATYNDRYAEFHVALDGVLDHPHRWSETTSFVIFQSSHDIRQIATNIKSPLVAAWDHFLIRKMDQKTALLFGVNNDREIWGLMPYLARI